MYHDSLALNKPIRHFLWQRNQINIKQLYKLLILESSLDTTCKISILSTVRDTQPMLSIVDRSTTLSIIAVRLQFCKRRKHPMTVPDMCIPVLLKRSRSAKALERLISKISNVLAHQHKGM